MMVLLYINASHFLVFLSIRHPDDLEKVRTYYQGGTCQLRFGGRLSSLIDVSLGQEHNKQVVRGERRAYGDYFISRFTLDGPLFSEKFNFCHLETELMRCISRTFLPILDVKNNKTSLS